MGFSRRATAAILLAAWCHVAPAAAQNAAPRTATVSVGGTGEAELKPDFARISALVRTQADTVALAIEANRTASQQVLDRLQGLGVKREDIRTANLQVFETPQRIGPDGREIRTPRFTAHHFLRVTSRDIDAVGRLAGEMLTIDGLNFQSVAWGLDRQEEGEDQARRAAVRDARRQAEVYAASADVKLGRLLEVRDGSVQPFGGAEQDVGSMRMVAAKAEPLPVVPPATIRYTASVQMVWEIAP